MNHGRLHITRLLLGGALAAGIIAGAVVLRTLSAAADGLPADVAAGARNALLAAVVVLTLAGALAGFAAARGLTRSLARGRSAILARARGDAAPPLRSRIAELDALYAAVDRLHARLRAREADSQREGQQLNVLLDTVSEGILQLDAEGRILRANRAAIALLGLAGTAPGQPVTTQVRNAELRRILEAAVAGLAVSGTEINLDERRLLVLAQPLPAGAGEAGAVIALVDLTELRRLEGVRRDFVANVSHELKTPLTSIRGYVETLLGEDDLPPDTRRQFLQVVEKNAGRLQSIVDDLLDLSRLQSGGWRPELLEVDAADVIDDVWSTCRTRAADRRIAFRPPAASATVLADPGGLRQILSNLFDNALRYTPDGGRIEVAVSRDQLHANGNGRTGAGSATTFVTFEVRDTGAGIPTDALPRIFERFYRVDPARSRADGGTGLGLAIVKHLVESMGGDVAAESELGKGTTIRFKLPAAPPLT